MPKTPHTSPKTALGQEKPPEVEYSIVYFKKAKKTAKKAVKKKAPKASTLKKKLWTIVSKRIRERDGYICFTSKKKVEGMNAHCGHGLPSSICGGRLRYHPLNLHCQSYNENINLGGNGTVYYQEQVKKYGKKRIDALYSLKGHFIKVDTDYYLKLIDLYTNGTWEEITEYLEQ